jgi:sortase A
MSTPLRDAARQHAAVANMTRDQITAIYANQQTSTEPAIQHEPEAAPIEVPTNVTETTPTVEEAPDVYDRTHQATHAVDPKQWEQYHSQWQKYYQQYYEQYYVGAVSQTHQAYQAHVAKLHEQIETQKQAEPAAISEKEAMHDLRSQLRAKISRNTKKVRQSRHFIPVISALTVLLVFLFLQYNSMILAYAMAYISPGNVDPQNIITDPNTSLAVDPAPKLIIPKINVDVPVDYTAKSDYDSQMAAMKTSIAYFGVTGANSKPGQMGNTPMAGHSSNDFTDSGAVKFVFARLDQMQKGDIFYLNYEGTRYTYTVSNVLIVLPNEVSKLQLGYDKPYATLITCTPLGTAEKRLLVIGEQVSPSPSKAAAAPSQTSSDTAQPSMAGKDPTLLERLFGAR